ncbi:hypothetical protein Hanom_Chr17g01531661 [Helianthus anomalus]
MYRKVVLRIAEYNGPTEHNHEDGTADTNKCTSNFHLTFNSEQIHRFCTACRTTSYGLKGKVYMYIFTQHIHTHTMKTVNKISFELTP